MCPFELMHHSPEWKRCATEKKYDVEQQIHALIKWQKKGAENEVCERKTKKDINENIYRCAFIRSWFWYLSSAISRVSWLAQFALRLFIVKSMRRSTIWAQRHEITQNKRQHETGKTSNVFRNNLCTEWRLKKKSAKNKIKTLFKFTYNYFACMQYSRIIMFYKLR